jgi:hypothetical protein
VNLHGIVAPIIASVNPLIPVSVQISTGPSVAGGKQTPTYATPGALTASIAGGVLTVAAVSQGFLMAGQTLSGANIPAGTSIAAQLSGTPGGPGNYQLSEAGQGIEVNSEAMTTALVVLGQVQPIATRDLMQLEGINLGGVRWKVYLNGEVDAIVRPERKGGDLITIATGRHQGVWLVVQVMEQFPDWCSAAIVQQNEA